MLMNGLKRFLSSLYARLALALVSIVILLGMGGVALMMYASDMYQQEVNQKLNRDLADNIVKVNPLFNERGVDHQMLESVFSNLMTVNPSVEIYLLDKTGTILAFSAPPGKVKQDAVALEPIRSFISGSAKIPLMGDDPRHPGDTKIFSVAPISEAGNLQGYLYVILGGEQYDSVAQRIQGSYITSLTVGWVVAGLCVALVAGLLVFALLTRHLRRLARKMDDFAQTGYTAALSAEPR